jgi:hypothetical protein
MTPGAFLTLVKIVDDEHAPKEALGRLEEQ